MNEIRAFLIGTVVFVAAMVYTAVPIHLIEGLAPTNFFSLVLLFSVVPRTSSACFIAFRVKN